MDTVVTAPAEKKRVNFDPTINAGHLLTATVFLITLMGSWFQMTARIGGLETALERQEKSYKEQMVRIETTWQQRYNEQQLASRDNEARTRESLIRIESAVGRLGDKLDTKADKMLTR